MTSDAFIATFGSASDQIGGGRQHLRRRVDDTQEIWPDPVEERGHLYLASHAHVTITSTPYVCQVVYSAKVLQIMLVAFC